MIASLIIPTYNGAKKLPDTLDALLLQSSQDFETIVVVDGSTDDSLAVLELYRTKLNSLIIYNQKNGGRAAARNAGAKLARTDLLIFIDDDIAVGEDNIQRHYSFHQGRNGDVLVGRPFMDRARIGADDYLNYRLFVEASWQEKFEHGLNHVSFHKYAFTTQNLSIRKDLFFEVGGFDERLTDSEDFDLSARLLLNKSKVFYDTSLMVKHHDYSDIKKTIARQVQYYQSKLVLLRMHPEYEELFPTEFAWRRRSVKDRVKGVMFNPRKFWLTLFRTAFFKGMPRSVKTILYSSFIYSHSVLLLKRS